MSLCLDKRLQVGGAIDQRGKQVGCFATRVMGGGGKEGTDVCCLFELGKGWREQHLRKSAQVGRQRSRQVALASQGRARRCLRRSLRQSVPHAQVDAAPPAWAWQRGLRQHSCIDPACAVVEDHASPSQTRSTTLADPPWLPGPVATERLLFCLSLALAFTYLSVSSTTPLSCLSLRAVCSLGGRRSLAVSGWRWQPSNWRWREDGAA